MTALFYMLNPLWEFLIAPGLLIAVGWWLHDLQPSPEPRRPYDWAQEDVEPGGLYPPT